MRTTIIIMHRRILLTCSRIISLIIHTALLDLLIMQHHQGTSMVLTARHLLRRRLPSDILFLRLINTSLLRLPQQRQEEDRPINRHRAARRPRAAIMMAVIGNTIRGSLRLCSLLLPRLAVVPSNSNSMLTRLVRRQRQLL